MPYPDRLGDQVLWDPTQHEYELYLEAIERPRTKTISLQTNGVYERFHTTLRNEFYLMLSERRSDQTTEELQADLDAWLEKTTNAGRTKDAGAASRFRRRFWIACPSERKEVHDVADEGKGSATVR